MGENVTEKKFEKSKEESHVSSIINIDKMEILTSGSCYVDSYVY